MTKVFCDICGKEIKENETCYRLTADTITHLIYRSDEVCNDCIEKINDYISSLKPEQDKQKDGD